MSSSYPCQLVNPLCPDDLCTRGYRHRGGHRLGTMRGDDRLVLESGHPMRIHRVKRGERPLTQDELASVGWERQRELFGDDLAG